jgi:SAM-dependent methyltransferase
LRFLGLIRPGGLVLDVAAGGGRHSHLLLVRGYRVVAIDRDVSGLADLRDEPRFALVAEDLEDGRPWPFAPRSFDGVIVTNYLYRPRLAEMIEAVAPGGVLLYETFASGQERYGRPSNPDFLLAPGELLEAVRGQLRVVAYEDMEDAGPRPACRQRLAAVRQTSGES